jgi:hypothetical protein
MVFRRSPIAAQRARNARMKAQAEQIAIERYPAAGEAGGVALPVIMLPANTRETWPLPDDTREQFLERLRDTLNTVFAQPVGEGDAPQSALDDTQHVSAMVARSCSTCRGECCTAGRDHAFLRAESLVRVRAQHPDQSSATLLVQYAAHLPEQHYRGSCVYHTPTGCNLPRDLRANICNRYVCGGVSQLLTALTRGGSTEVIVAAADSVHLRRMARIDRDASNHIALTPSLPADVIEIP